MASVTYRIVGNLSQQKKNTVWNPVLGQCCRYHVGQCIRDILTEAKLWKSFGIMPLRAGFFFFFSSVREDDNERLVEYAEASNSPGSGKDEQK